jgi:RNA polymerase sigma factor (sigma-70 family)
MNTSNTIALVDDCLNHLNSGDHSVLERLVEHSYERFRVFASRQLRHFPTAKKYNDTQDILHDVLLKMLKKIKSNPPSCAQEFFAIVSRDIRNHLVDQLRYFLGRVDAADESRPSRDKLYGPCDALDIEVQQQTYDPSKIQLWTEFHQCADQLPEELRLVVDLMFYQGFTQEESANVLAISRKVLRNRWTKAKLILSEVLPEDPQVVG